MKTAIQIFDIDITPSAISVLKVELINAEHQYEAESLKWKNTLILKFLK